MLEAIAIIELNQLHAAKKFGELAEHPMIYLKPEWVIELASNENYGVRSSLATNPAITQFPEIAMKLAKDEKWLVRACLAENPDIAQLPEVAMKLAKDEAPAACRWLADNPAVARLPAVVKKLCISKDIEVRRSLVGNVNAHQFPEDVLVTLANDPKALVAKYLVPNPILAQFQNSPPVANKIK